MVIISDALPIQFWPYGEPTFNESTFAFVTRRKFIQEFGTFDNIKLQLTDDNLSNDGYRLSLRDANGIELANKDFIKTAATSYNRFDLEFTFSEFSLADQQVQLVIIQNPGTLDAGTLDSGTLDTEGSGTDFYRSDFISFVTTPVFNQAWGSKVISYKSSKNFAGIKYPGNGNYFSIRIACRFYKPRNVKVSTQIPLSGSNVVTTSIVSTQQRFFETVLLPHYMLNKLELILQHCVSGSVVIDGQQWQSNESFDRLDIDTKCAFDMANTWLTSGVERNII